MRSENEMMEQIKKVAKEDERIRAVYMNGSRTNANVPRDCYQDYDIVYVVTETVSFIADKDWIKVFGNPLMVQEPDWYDALAADGGIPDFSKRYAWLMLFDDGVRIDLSIVSPQEASAHFLDDKLTVVLLDKDGLLPRIPEPTDMDYYIEKPSEGKYLACCNNFWWCLNNVAKGIARDELSYTKYMLDQVVRSELHLVMNWYIGCQCGFALTTGKQGKYYRKYLSDELYQRYRKTYAGSEYGDIWASLYVMCDLFHTLATAIAESMGYTYQQHEEKGMRAYLHSVETGLGVTTVYRDRHCGTQMENIDIC